MIEENTEQNEKTVNHTTENLESVGQMIIGGLEQVGGILTGDPITRAEGEFNAEVGSLHQESNKNLTAIDEHLHSEETSPITTEEN
jgi:hypothetical protein